MAKTTIQKILDLTRQLYPTGRAWSLRQNSVFGKLHEGLAESEKAIYDELNNILFSVLPDNDNFSETDAANWEKALGLISDSSTDLDTRKAAIERKINHPGDIPARQHYLYLERELQSAGFDVYVHENRFADGAGGYNVANPVATNCGLINCGAANSGVVGVDYDGIIANEVDSTKDENFTIGSNENARATFFIGGQSFGTLTVVDNSRMMEFRSLVLSLKPAQTAALLQLELPIFDTYNDIILDTYNNNIYEN